MHTAGDRPDAPVRQNSSLAAPVWAGLYAVRGMRGRTIVAWVAAVLLTVSPFVGGPVQAQIGGSGSINGIVTDQTGAVVSGATVTATNTATNATTTQTTSGSGTYVLSPLIPGDYT